MDYTGLCCFLRSVAPSAPLLPPLRCFLRSVAPSAPLLPPLRCFLRSAAPSAPLLPPLRCFLRSAASSAPLLPPLRCSLRFAASSAPLLPPLRCTLCSVVPSATDATRTIRSNTHARRIRPPCCATQCSQDAQHMALRPIPSRGRQPSAQGCPRGRPAYASRHTRPDARLAHALYAPYTLPYPSTLPCTRPTRALRALCTSTRHTRALYQPSTYAPWA